MPGELSRASAAFALKVGVSASFNFMAALLARLLCIALLVLSWWAQPAAAQDSRLTVSSSTREVALNSWVRVVEDAGKNKTVEQILDAPLVTLPGSADGAINFGYTTAAYWLVVPLDNPEKNPLERLLRSEQPAHTR